MSPPKNTQVSAQASAALVDAYTDFVLSRQAMNVSPYTMRFYRFTAGKFVEWLNGQNVTDPAEVTARHVRQYLAMLAGRGLQDTTLHDYARAIRTLLRFWRAEGYMAQPITFDMPKLAKKRLPVLTAEQLQTVVKVCGVRERALVLFLADSGLRRSEVLRLNWGDVDMQTGLVRVAKGKGGKDRSAVVGAVTRRALLAYRRTLTDRDGALFQTERGPRRRLTARGLVAVFRKLSGKSGIHVTAHALRRTFVILSLRAGMNVLHLQALLGHASLRMVQHYAQLEELDLLTEHRAHSPVDRL
jgi:integrase/recombinase XerD